MNTNELIGAKIREIREQKHINATALSIEAGIDKSTLSKIENGKMDITIVRLEQIANALREPIYKFLPSAGNVQINQDESSNNSIINTQINNTDPILKELVEKLLQKLK